MSTCGLCREFDEVIALLEGAQRGEGVDGALTRALKFLKAEQDAHVDQAGEAAWNDE